MSGKRQHYVPRLLQKGFASHVNGDDVFTWVFREGVEPFNPNIKNVGVEGFFYTNGNNFELDDQITNLEGPFSDLVTNLRSSSPNQHLNASKLAPLIAHLEVRTRHLRQSFLNSSTRMLEVILRFAQDENRFESFIRRKLAADDNLMREAMVEEMTKRGISTSYLPEVMKAARPMLEHVLPNTTTQMAQALQQLLPVKATDYLGAMKRGHIKGLSGSLWPISKENLYARLNYQMEEAAGDLILGDSAVLFATTEERKFAPFLAEPDQLQAVLLPVSPSQVVVGRISPCDININQLPTEISRCSLEYFIGSTASEANLELSAEIGKNAYLISDAEIEKMVAESITG